MSLVLRDSSFTTKRMVYCDYSESGTNVPKHSHHCYEIDFFVKADNTTHVVNGDSIPVRSGSLIAMCERDFHQYSVQDPLADSYCAYSVQFSNYFLDELGEERFRLILSKQLECGDGEEYDRFLKMFTLLHYEVTRDPEDTDGIGRLILQAIISSALRLTTSYGAAIDSRRLFENEITYVNRHFKENISLNDVAEHVGYSTAYLSKMFKLRHGLSFKKYLLNKRLNYAKSLLLSSTLSVTEIAVQAGFANLAHFSKAFKDRYGNSPTEFRSGFQSPK